LGLALRGRVPFVSTFAAFLTRAFDQIRMSQYSEGNIKFVGSHAGVSIGEDGPSQMGLEDIAMFRSIAGSTVLHPSDAVSASRLVVRMARHQGLAYMRTMRQDTPVIYGPGEEFPIGGCKVLKQSDIDAATIVAAGVCVHEALAAADILARNNVKVRVIDLYSIKPLDTQTLLAAARETACIVTAEDHYPEGGLGEAVMAALAFEGASIIQLAVRSRPHSGEGADLRQRAGIDAASIADAVGRGIAHQQSRAATRDA
ncbi:MAG: transketolase family protein, partial [Opitutaceae bacterium]